MRQLEEDRREWEQDLEEEQRDLGQGRSARAEAVQARDKRILMVLAGAGLIFALAQVGVAGLTASPDSVWGRFLTDRRVILQAVTETSSFRAPGQ